MDSRETKLIITGALRRNSCGKRSGIKGWLYKDTKEKSEIMRQSREVVHQIQSYQLNRTISERGNLLLGITVGKPSTSTSPCPWTIQNPVRLFNFGPQSVSTTSFTGAT